MQRERIHAGLKQTLITSCLGPIAILITGATVRADDPPLEVVIRLPRIETVAKPELSARQRKNVNEAIERAVKYLRRIQNPANGVFGEGFAMGRSWPVGFAALPGLSLLECGVPAKDPAVQNAAFFVRKVIPSQTRTYEIALAILFLARLGEDEDRPLIRSLALRLAAGQGPVGGWSYNCPLLTPAQEKKLIVFLEKSKDDLLRLSDLPKLRGKSEAADNSNTQFAILALWVARKHDLPLDGIFAKIEHRFRASQRAGGWDYRFTAGRGQPYGSMTCVGLLGLAVGRGSVLERSERPAAGKLQDEGIQHGLRSLAPFLADPADRRLRSAFRTWGPDGAVNLYFLWSVERVGVLCNVQTIGGEDWYRWGVDLLLPMQRPDGSWLGRGSGGAPAIDTSFALLFLKRSDLLPDLRETLQKRLTITDPGPDPKARESMKAAKKGKGPKKKTVRDESPETKDDPPPADAPLRVHLGEVKAGKQNQLPLRVRGPAAFRITGIRGNDNSLLARADSQSREVHELRVTLYAEKEGDFERTIYLQTDLPGRGEVAVRIQARATKK